MPDIRRIDITQPPGPRMTRAVVHGDRVFLAGLPAETIHKITCENAAKFYGLVN